MRNTLLFTLLILAIEMSAQVTWEVSASLNYLHKTANNQYYSGKSSGYSRINDSMYVRIVTNYDGYQEHKYAARPGTDFGVACLIKVLPRLALRTGMAIQYARADHSFGLGDGEALIDFGDTLHQSQVPWFFSNNPTCDFTNTYASVGAASPVTKYQTWSLGIPLLAEYAVAPNRFYISAGLQFQTPIASTKRWEGVTVERDESKTPISCTYVLNKYTDRTGAELRHASWHVSGSASYQLTPRVKVELGARKSLTNVFQAPFSTFVSHYPLGKILVPWVWQAGVRYAF